MKKIIFISLLCSTISCSKKEHHEATRSADTIDVIAFGSCGDQRFPQPVLERVVEQKPDLFIYLGDNIYSDTYSMDTLKKNYAILAAKPEFQKLRAATRIVGTWDDHDYGWNDSGRHYPHKEQSKEIFLKFFSFADSSIREHPGIYYSLILAKQPKVVQLIMLDMRTFRDKLLPYDGSKKNDPRYNYGLEYSPYTTKDSTMLGKAQWQWLEEQLSIPADIRIIGSSTQFGITHNGYESWANFPGEQQRMLDLIKQKKASGIIFISGDVHYAELSKLKEKGLYPIYDLTSSGITSTWDFATPNDNRIEGPIMENHFGVLKFNWKKQDPEITMQIIDVKGETRISRTLPLSELSF